MSWRKCQEVVNPVTVHVKFETPEDLEDAIFDLVSSCKEGAICRGSNEVTKAAERGYKVCVWPSHINEKDINDMVMMGMDPVDIKQIIDTNTHQGLKAKLAITAWKL